MNRTALEFDELSREYITATYQGLSGFISYQPGEKESNEKQKVFLTYGEILYPSVNKIIEELKITENDVFCDLGSGIGKVALQFLLKTPVRKAFGIEASEARHRLAEKVYHQVKNEFPDLFAGGRELKSLQGNFLEADLSDVSIIYTCSTCFNEELLQAISQKLQDLPKLRYVVSMKQLPGDLPLANVLEIECTWDKTKCHVYIKA